MISLVLVCCVGPCMVMAGTALSSGPTHFMGSCPKPLSLIMDSSLWSSLPMGLTLACLRVHDALSACLRDRGDCIEGECWIRSGSRWSIYWAKGVMAPPLFVLRFLEQALNSTTYSITKNANWVCMILLVCPHYTSLQAPPLVHSNTRVSLEQLKIATSN
jgi:hypothetical protein